MRNITILVVFILCSATALSQDLTRKISLQVNNLPLEEVINEIETKADIQFSYSTDAINASQSISFRVRKKSVKYILNKFFLPRGITYKKVGEHIVLRPLNSEEELLYAPDKDQYFTISGYLRDRRTGEVLIGAHVYEEETFTGTATNAYGFYSHTLPAGEQRIVYSFLGYEKNEEKVKIKKKKKKNITLRELNKTNNDV